MKQFLYSLFLVGFLVGCQPDEKGGIATTNQPTYRVVAVSYPLQFLAKKIATHPIVVEFPAADADDPRNWNPQIDDIAAMQKADLILTNGPGIDYANWLIKVTLPDSRVVKTSDGLALSDFIKVDGPKIVHSHGPEGEHSHPFMVAYSWLSPAIALKQTEFIAKKMSEKYPDQAAGINDNLKLVREQLDELTQALADIDSSGVTFTSVTPHTRFLTTSAGISEFEAKWNVVPDGDNEQDILSAEDLPSSSVILATEQPNQNLAQFAKDNNHQVVVIDLIDDSQNGNYFEVMQMNIKQLRQAVEQAK